VWILILFANFRLGYLPQSQLVLVLKQRDSLASSRAQAAPAFHSHRRSRSQLLEAVCSVQNRQRPQDSEVSEQQEPLALVRVMIFNLSSLL